MEILIKKNIIITDIITNKDCLYKGDPNYIPLELFDELFIASDTSNNPSRPFRWYKFINGCCYTDNEDSIKKGRHDCLIAFLEKMNNPKLIYIYNNN